MTNILDIRESDLINYKGQRVGFHDKILLDKEGKPTAKTKLYIYITNGEDRYSIYNQPAKEKKIIDNFGNVTFIHEKELYRRAYEAYLKRKEALNNNIMPDSLFKSAAKSSEKKEAPKASSSKSK